MKMLLVCGGIGVGWGGVGGEGGIKEVKREADKGDYEVRETQIA